MGTKGEKDRAKQIQERCQSILVQLLKDEDNKYCVDCDAKGPRWASWNLGIFLCIRCAGIHRNLGVHISRVKSVNLDSWTPEQVVSLQQMGNSRARAVYEANLPDSFRRPQSDSALEAFVRAKYELKKYIAKEWVPTPVPKVNWDKEIDEEIERQKKKKKSSLAPLPAAPPATDKRLAKSDVIPQLLPKPKSSSPKQNRHATSTSEARPSNGAADLLGLATSNPEPTQSHPKEDIFSNFFSAEQKQEPQPETSDLKTEEHNFFNQAAPTEKEKSKMTKDSILALYSQSPVSNQFNTAQSGYSQQFPFQQQNFASFPQNGQFNPPAQSFNQFGSPQSSQFNQSHSNAINQPQSNHLNQPQSSQFNQSLSNAINQPQLNHFNQPQSSQFSSQSQFGQAQFSQSFNQIQQPPFQGQTQSFGQFGASFQPQNGQNGQFSNSQQPLSQQFGNMSLGQSFAQQNANVANNILWQ